MKHLGCWMCGLLKFGERGVVTRRLAHQMHRIENERGEFIFWKCGGCNRKKKLRELVSLYYVRVCTFNCAICVFEGSSIFPFCCAQSCWAE